MHFPAVSLSLVLALTSVNFRANSITKYSGQKCTGQELANVDCDSKTCHKPNGVDFSLRVNKTIIDILLQLLNQFCRLEVQEPSAWVSDAATTLVGLHMP